MTYVVSDNCINCKHTTCVAVCPTDAFREGKNFLVINPDECIDCNLCPVECPIGAIYEEDDLPEDQRHFIELNAKLSKEWQEIYTVKEPLPEHEKWTDVPNKIQFLEV